MGNPQTNKGQKLTPQDEVTSKGIDQLSHFDRARKIIESWPEWKRSINCAPISSNGNQTAKHSNENK